MEKPKHYLVFKILFIVFAIVTVAGIVLSVQGFGNFENNNFMIGGFMGTFGLFATFVCAGVGFRPELTKLSVKSAKYIQQQNANKCLHYAVFEIRTFLSGIRLGAFPSHA